VVVDIEAWKVAHFKRRLVQSGIFKKIKKSFAHESLYSAISQNRIFKLSYFGSSTTCGQN
jgi:hypothetical protein